MGLEMVLITPGGGSARGLFSIYVAMMVKKSLLYLISQRVLASAPDGSLVADTNWGLCSFFFFESRSNR